MIRWVTVLAAITAAWGVGSTSAAAEGVLVFGGTGRLGAPHVRMLLERGETVTVFHRTTSSFRRLEGLEFERFEGNLLDADSVLAAMQRAKPRVVIDTTARRGATNAIEDRFYTPVMAHIVAAAKAMGVEQIIIHSSIGVRDSVAAVAAYMNSVNAQAAESPDVEPVDFQLDNNANLIDKGDAEIVLEESGIDYTIVRNGLLDFEPATPTGRGELLEDEMAFGRITRTDLARITLECLDNAGCFGKIYHAVDTSLVGERPGTGSTD